MRKIGVLTVVSGILIAAGWAALWVLHGAWLGGPIPPLQERIATFRDLPWRSQALIAAIKQFQADHGSPPKDLQVLVPKYLPAIPNTGVARFPSYEYKVFLGGGLDRIVWYDLGPTEKGVLPSQPKYCTIGPSGHAVLVVQFHRHDRVYKVEADRLTEDSGSQVFNPELWRSDKRSRKVMVASFCQDVACRTMSWPDLIGLLGEPDGMGFMWETPWELSVNCYWGFWEANRVIYWPTERYPIIRGSSFPIGNWLFVNESI